MNQMDESVLTLEGHIPTLKEVIRSIIINVPGSAIAMSMVLIATLYVVWSSLKAGVYFSKGLTMQQAYVKGFYKSAFSASPVCMSRTLYVCALVLAFLICAFRGILGFIYVSLM